MQHEAIIIRASFFLHCASSSSGTMGPAPVGAHCLSCNEFPFSAILGQTVQLLKSSLTPADNVVHPLSNMACLFYSFRLQFGTSVSLTSCCPPSCSCGQTVGVSSEWLQFCVSLLLILPTQRMISCMNLARDTVVSNRSLTLNIEQTATDRLIRRCLRSIRGTSRDTNSICSLFISCQI